MEISEFTLKLIIILVPGGLASIIFQKLTIQKKWNSFQFITNSILLGGLSYLTAYAFLVIINSDLIFKGFWQNLPLNQIPFPAVIISTIASMVIGFLGAGLDTFKIVNRLATFLKLSTKYGDENLFTYFLSDRCTEEIYIRDLPTNQTYQGMILSYSETDDIKEVVLRDVKVFDYESSAYLYSSRLIYLSRPKDFLTLEVEPVIDKLNEPNDGKEIDSSK